MDGWFGYLLLAGLFFLMMRFGCGSHMARGHAKGHSGHEGHGDDHGGKHKDPVCGMEVEANKGYGKMYKDELHRFCSKKCLDEFDNDAERYLSEKAAKP